MENITIEEIREECKKNTELITINRTELFDFETYLLNGSTIIIRKNNDTGHEKVFITDDPENIMKRLKERKN